MPAFRVNSEAVRADRAHKLEKCQQILNYRFRNEAYLWEALQQTGSNSGTDFYLPKGNKTMAHLGDAVFLMYIRRTAWKRGLLAAESHMLGELVRPNARMNIAGRQLGIDGCINLNPSAMGIIQPGGKVVADAIEAIIGAVWLDSDEDLQIVTNVIESLGLQLPDDLPGSPSSSSS